MVCWLFKVYTYFGRSIITTFGTYLVISAGHHITDGTGASIHDLVYERPRLYVFAVRPSWY